MIGLDPVSILNSGTQSVKRFHTDLIKILHQQICQRKIVRSRIVFVCIHIGEDVLYIHKVGASKYAAKIMESAERNSCLLQIVE